MYRTFCVKNTKNGSTAYISLCRLLKYVLKTTFFIQNYPNVAGFFIFETFYSMFEKNITKMCLVPHIFIKLSQNVCLMNTHILMYWYARFNCKLWRVHWFYCVFWIFSYIIDDNSCLNCCISTKLPLFMYLISDINVHILIRQHVKCDCRLWKILWFFGNFHILLQLWNVTTSSNFYKLCIKAEV